jgi:hypothetical protein
MAHQPSLDWVAARRNDETIDRSGRRPDIEPAPDAGPNSATATSGTHAFSSENRTSSQPGGSGEQSAKQPAEGAVEELAGRGRSSRTAPPHCGCLRYTCPAPDGGSPGACGALVDSNQVPGGGIRRSSEHAVTVAVGQATTVPPARHSTRWGTRETRLMELSGAGAPTGGVRGVQHRRWESGGVAGDPSTSRSGARTFAGSPATWRPLSLRGWGGVPRKGQDRRLYGVETNL